MSQAPRGSRSLDELGRRLYDLERQVVRLNAGPRLAHAQILDGAIEQAETVDTGEVDETGTPVQTTRLVARIGAQPDGTNAVVVHEGPTPPAPTEPGVIPGPGFLAVSWDGRFADDAAAPLDFAGVEVHVGTADDVLPSPATLRGTLPSTDGGEMVVGSLATGTYLISLVTRSLAGRASEPAPYSEGGPGAAATSVQVQAAIDAAAAATAAAQAAQAAGDAATAQAAQALTVAAGRNRSTVAPSGSPPADPVAGDLWIVTDAGNTLRRYDGQAWVSVRDTGIGAAQDAAANAVTLASSKSRVTYSTAAPSGAGTAGDIWFTINNTGAAVGIARYDGTAWRSAPVSGQALAGGTVTAAQLAVGAVTAVELAARSVEASHITAGAVTAGALAAGAVVAGSIASEAVTAAALAAGAVTTGKLAAGAVTANELAAGAVTAVKIAAATITGDKIAANSIATAHLAAGSVTAAKLTSALVLSTRIIAGDPAGARVEMNTDGLFGYGTDSDAPTVAITPGGTDYLTLTDANGAVVASVTADGTFAGANLSADTSIAYRGSELQDLLDSLPGGVIARGVRTSNSTAVNAESPYLELSVDLTAGRLYEIATASIQVSNDTTNGRSQIAIRYTTDGSSPGTGSTLLCYGRVSHPTATYIFPVTLRRFLAPTTSATFRFLMTHTGEVGKAYINGVAFPAEMYVVDQGKFVTDVGVDRAGASDPQPTTQPAAKKNYTTTWTATNSGSYREDGSKRTDTADLVQGYNSANGDGKALVMFPAAMQSALAGSTVTKVEVYLYANHWWYNSGGTARVSAHGYSSLPASKPQGTSIMDSASWPNPGGRWVTLPSSTYARWANGTFTGIMLGPANTTSLTYYGRFNGASAASAVPKIRVSYTK